MWSPAGLLVLLASWEMAAGVGVKTHTRQVFRGRFDGKCSGDGIYYRDSKSFVFCSYGNSYIQPCAPGTENSEYAVYEDAIGRKTHNTEFCNINLVDSGYYKHPGAYMADIDLPDRRGRRGHRERGEEGGDYLPGYNPRDKKYTVSAYNRPLYQPPAHGAQYRPHTIRRPTARSRPEVNDRDEYNTDRSRFDLNSGQYRPQGSHTRGGYEGQASRLTKTENRYHRESYRDTTYKDDRHDDAGYRDTRHQGDRYEATRHRDTHYQGDDRHQPSRYQDDQYDDDRYHGERRSEDSYDVTYQRRAGGFKSVHDSYRDMDEHPAYLKEAGAGEEPRDYEAREELPVPPEPVDPEVEFRAAAFPHLSVPSHGLIIKVPTRKGAYSGRQFYEKDFADTQSQYNDVRPKDGATHEYSLDRRH